MWRERSSLRARAARAIQLAYRCHLATALDRRRVVPPPLTRLRRRNRTVAAAPPDSGDESTNYASDATGGDSDYTRLSLATPTLTTPRCRLDTSMPGLRAAGEGGGESSSEGAPAARVVGEKCSASAWRACIPCPTHRTHVCAQGAHAGATRAEPRQLLLATQSRSLRQGSRPSSQPADGKSRAPRSIR